MKKINIILIFIDYIQYIYIFKIWLFVNIYKEIKVFYF